MNIVIIFHIFKNGLSKPNGLSKNNLHNPFSGYANLKFSEACLLIVKSFMIMSEIANMISKFSPEHSLTPYCHIYFKVCQYIHQKITLNEFKSHF